MSPPFFSVVIPLYNREGYVGRAIVSVLNQIFQDFELVVVDDGSTDKSATVASGFSDSRLRLLNQRNGGEGSARNRGIQSSRGSWVAFLDPDDVWGPNHLSELREIIKRFPEAGIVSSTFRETWEGDDLSFLTPAGRKSGKLKKIDYFSVGWQMKVVHSSSIAISRTVCEEVGKFGPFRMGADSEYWVRVALRFPVAVSSLTTVAYMRGNGGIVETLKKEASHLSRVAPRTTSELSPSFPVILQWLATVDATRNPIMRKAVCRFVGVRLNSMILGAIVDGNCSDLRALGAIYPREFSRPLNPWKALAKMPCSGVRLASRSWSFLRSSREQLRGLRS